MLESRIIAEIAIAFVSIDDFDTRVNKALKIAGLGLEVSRSYLFLDSEDGLSTSNTHEWCAPGIDSQITKLQRIPYEDIVEWKEYLERGEVHAIRNVTTQPQRIQERVASLQEATSVMISPVIIKGHRRGFVGFDECTRQRTWCFSEINILKALGDMIAATMTGRSLARPEFEILYSDKIYADYVLKKDFHFI